MSPCFTGSRATLFYVKQSTTRNQNVTLSLPVSLLRQFRVYAAEQNKSMSSLAAEAIRKLVDENDTSKRAMQKYLERIRNAPDRGTGGKITWTREEIHQRGKGF